MPKHLCGTCYHWTERSACKLGICSRFPELQEKTKDNRCGEHSDLKDVAITQRLAALEKKVSTLTYMIRELNGKR